MCSYESRTFYYASPSTFSHDRGKKTETKQNPWMFYRSKGRSLLALWFTTEKIQSPPHFP